MVAPNNDLKLEESQAAHNNLPTWDLSDLYKSPQDPRLASDKERLSILVEDFKKRFKHQAAEYVADESSNSSLAYPLHASLKISSPQELLVALQSYQDIQSEMLKITSYAYLCYATRVSDPAVSAFLQEQTDFVQKLGVELVFFDLALSSFEDEALKSWFKDGPELAYFCSFFEQARRHKPYQLTELVEQALIKKQPVARSLWVTLYDETLAGLDFTNPVNQQPASISEMLNLLLSGEKTLRDQAATALKKGLTPQVKLFASILNSILKDHAINNELRGYAKPYTSMNLHNLIDDEVMGNLVCAVKDSYKDITHEYYQLKANLLGLKKLKYWDRNAPVFTVDFAFTFQEAKDLVLAAFNSFNPKFGLIAEKFFTQKWIDAKLQPGKMSGAFSHPTSTKVHPYIMVNFHGKYIDVSTLAHELGHGIHQYLAREVGELQASTPLVLAETASIFAEELLFDYMLLKTDEVNTKRYLISSKIEGIINSVHRQIAFHCFEEIVHSRRAEGAILTAQDISEVFLKTQAECLGEAVELDPEDGVFWTYVSHFFHVPFYVYAYAFGDCLVRSLYGLYKKERVAKQSAGDNSSSLFMKNYQELLAQGGRLMPHEAVKKFGFDLHQPEFWTAGLSSVKELIDQLKSMH